MPVKAQTDISLIKRLVAVGTKGRKNKMKMLNLDELEKFLATEPEGFEQMVHEAYDKIDAMLLTLETVGITKVSIETATVLRFSIYVYDESRCNCCGLKGGH